jgi:uncharacterized membrane protein YeiB
MNDKNEMNGMREGGEPQDRRQPQDSWEPEPQDKLDLALAASLRAMRDLPEEPLRSVAADVMHRLTARERRLTALRWSTVVGAAALIGVGINAFGLAIFTYMYKLLFHSGTSEAVAAYTAAYTKLAGALRGVVETLGLKFLRSALGYDLGSYQAQLWLAALGAAVVIILVMYLMSVWLGKPKEGKSWLARRSLHNGLQVW